MQLEDIKGLGPKTINLLRRLGINDYNDLITYYPYRYDVIKKTDVVNGEKVVIDGVLESLPTVTYLRNHKDKMSFKLNTGDHLFNVVIFNRGFLKSKLSVGTSITVIGKYEKNMIVASDIKFKLIGDETRIEPIYHVTTGINSSQLNNIIINAINDDIIDYVPDYLNKKYDFKKKLYLIKKKKKNKKIKLKENHYFSGTVASPENTMTVELGGHKLSFDVRGFFQSNLFVFEKVCRLITSLLPGGKNILDMYSGCGSISAFLTEKYENVVLVEHNRDAIVFAEQNLTGTKHVSYGLSGAAWVKTCAATLPPFDAVTIDPPRSGMEKEVCQWLCASKIPLILSLSCDPATHARDCAHLIKAGYNLKQMYLLDFYPNTSHIESLCVLELEQ